jgi:uncharacterized Zn-binding protein involved in type VI secretion
MGQRAARFGDFHLCGATNPSNLKPHIGGPITPPCCITVRIGGLPAARLGDVAKCFNWFESDVIMTGSTTVRIGGKPAARVGDGTLHFGKIVRGCATVRIGD